MPLLPLKMPPGIRDVGTQLQTKGRWRDCNFVRWIEGVMQPVGKWVRTTEQPLVGRVSGLRSLRDNTFRRWLMVGTHERCYVQGEGTVRDVTPSDFVPGRATTSAGGGYSAAEYGLDEYGTPRTAPTSLTLEAQSWSFDRWGEFLVATCISDGRAFVWRPGDLSTPADSELQVIDNAPTGNRALVVTDERHLMLLGAGGDPRLVQWSAREDYTEWTPTALNLAGDLLLETSGTLQVAEKVGSEILVLSDTDAFSVRYTGVPFGYGREHVGSNCGVIGPHASVATDDFAVWMGINGFYVYRGQVTPLPCEVWDFVFRDMNYHQRALITAAHNTGFSEVWWFFPVGDELKNNRYVVWNYRANIWYVGYIERTAWQNRGVLDSPVASGEDGHLYEHERGLTPPGAQPRPRPYIESSPIELGDGEQVLAVTQLIPDRDSVAVDALRFSFTTRFAPRLPPTTHGPYSPNAEGYVPTRFTGRQMELRVEANQDVDWRLGVLRAEVKRGGKR